VAMVSNGGVERGEQVGGASGVSIGTGSVTVTILDNDSAPPPTCPDGQTGTPPNCVPVVPGEDLVCEGVTASQQREPGSEHLGLEDGKVHPRRSPRVLEVAQTARQLCMVTT